MVSRVPVVCDTSPLSYLVLIGEADLLPTLYGEVLIPPIVEEELRHPSGPFVTRQWIQERPSWLRVSQPPEEALKDLDSELVETLQALDRGEREAIRLAEGSGASLLVIDERDGRSVARRLGLSITGTIGVLDVAASDGLIDVVDVTRQLRDTSFRASPELYRWLLDRHS